MKRTLNPAGKSVEYTECPLLTLDRVVYSQSTLLCLWGWSPSPNASVRRLTVLGPKIVVELAGRCQRLLRPDVTAVFPNLPNTNHFGWFAALVATPEQLQNTSLRLETCYGAVSVMPLNSINWESVTWAELSSILRPLGTPALRHLPTLIDALHDQGCSDGAQQLTQLLAEWLATHHPVLPQQFVESPDHDFFAIDRVWALSNDTLLLVGWWFQPDRRSVHVKLYTLSGQSLALTGRLFSLPREDVAQGYRKQFPDIPTDTGWICEVSLPGLSKAICCIELRSTEGLSCWLRVPDPVNPRGSYAKWVSEILNWIPQPRRLQNRLHLLFDQVLGPALSAVETTPVNPKKIELFDYGTLVAKPRVSILVPLLEQQYTILRHQLAQFAEDPDFQAIELLYLIGDPSTVPATLELAAAIQSLFAIPFRIVHTPVSLGSADLNNLGSQLARADYLLLLSAEVIPLYPEWLRHLLTALENLPDAGAVSPLLHFPEGAIYHAGTIVEEHPVIPGFLSNRLLDRGQVWRKVETPIERVGLTTACLLLRSADYRACGGMDERYQAGDFLESDLCLALRRFKKRLYLLPTVHLCHLGRSSPTATDLTNDGLLTLYSAWRFREKIRIGHLPDPQQIAKE